MESAGAYWYREGWTLEIKGLSWVEDTQNQVDFLIRTLALTGKERILDLACGFGRHALELARRGFPVVGVDLTRDYVEDARRQADREHLDAEFLLSDIRDVSFEQKFDVVLNMGDGAIGYLESESENEKIFDVIARALKPGGKHFMDIVNAGYADTHFPCRRWEAGEKGLTLSQFEWDGGTKIMLYGQRDYPYGTPLWKPEMGKGSPIRLYHLDEIGPIMSGRGMHVVEAFSDFYGAPASDAGLQLLVYTQKGR